MSLWPTPLFITSMSGENLYQQYNFEILNNTSFNFARPGTPTDSHTAAMTAERKKLREQLPRINTGVTKNYLSQENSSSLKNTHVNSRNGTRNSKNSTAIKSPDQIENAGVTQAGYHVKFAVDSNPHERIQTEVDVADHDNESKEEERDVNGRKHRSRKIKAYRRASAPAQGIDYQGVDYYFKNAKQACPNNKRKGISIPTVHIETDETVDEHEDNTDNTDNVNNINDINDRNDRNDRNMNSSMSSSITSLSSTVSHCNPPSLSPCSSSSSLSSSVDMLSPALKQPSFPQAYANFTNPWAMRPKLKIISTDNESHSLPDIVPGSSYDDIPWSPAAMFLANYANSNLKQPLPDEEGQQVGEYIMGKVIGRGGFSTVKQAYTVDNYSGSMETVAVKIVKNINDSDDNERIQALLEREIAIWRRLDHPNIVNMISVEENDYATFVFSEYCPGGTLLDYVKKHCKCEGRGLDENEARNIFLEIAEGVRYLHNDMRLVHKDIKLDNILLDKDDTWKICDFGLTEFQSSANGFNDLIYNSAVGGSIAYCAPEQLRTPTPLKDPSVDVWSLGVVLFAMVTGQLPFSDSFEPRLQFKIINGRYDESLLDDSRVSCEFKDLLKGMFKTKPDQRLTINEVLEHRWCER